MNNNHSYYSLIVVSQGKNSKTATLMATSANWRIFAELKNSKRVLSKMNLTSMKVSIF